MSARRGGGKDSIVQEGHARKGPQDSISRSADQVADLQ